MVFQESAKINALRTPPLVVFEESVIWHSVILIWERNHIFFFLFPPRAFLENLYCNNYLC